RRFLARERAALTAYFPELADALASCVLANVEVARSPAIEWFRTSGAGNLLIPSKWRGRGASALDAVRVQRAIGSRAPSLAVASAMHHFSVATVVEMAERGTGLEGLLLEGIASRRLLVASGFSEGVSGQSILAPAMRVARTADGLRITGSKKPCSLAWSMDLLTASVVDGAELFVVLIPAESEGLSRKPFWSTPVLGGAESDEVVLDGVLVPDRLAFRAGSPEQMDDVQTSGFLWFELLITASYIGIASALVERVLEKTSVAAVDAIRAASGVEASMAALETIALAMDGGARGGDELARLLLIRGSIQSSIHEASSLVAELLGGMSFISSGDVAYLLAASRALSFHPPSRLATARGVARYLAGAELRIE
ncbi:MAG TPA: acyl-CoA dehydrogenase, partial [Thermoanaerobaculia bacterium]